MRERKWVRCPNCGHKLFELTKNSGSMTLQTKCHSCRCLVEINIDGQGVNGKLV